MVTINPKIETKRFGASMFKGAMYLAQHPDKYIKQGEIAKNTGVSTTALASLLRTKLITPYKGNMLHKHNRKFKMSNDQISDFLFGGWVSKRFEMKYFHELMQVRNYIRGLTDDKIEEPADEGFDMLSEAIEIESKNNEKSYGLDIEPIVQETQEPEVKKETQTDSFNVARNYIRAREMFEKHFGTSPEQMDINSWKIIRKVIGS